MIIQAVAAVIVRPGAFLAVKRTMDKIRDPGVWEFPGGKIEHNETPLEALHREVKEELGVSLRDVQPLLFYPFYDGEHTIHLTYYSAQLIDDEHQIKLVDHDQWQWFGEKDFHPEDWLDGDEQILHILKEMKIL